MNIWLKRSMILLFLLVMGFLMVNSIELEDPEDQCDDNQTLKVIDGVWSCGNATSYGNTTPISLINNNFGLIGCGNGQLYKYNTGSSSWVCSADETGAAGTVTGSGTIDTIAIWTDTSELGDSIMIQDGSSIVVDGSYNASNWGNVSITMSQVSDENWIENGQYADLDTDSTDDFSGSWNDLSNVPAGFADNIDNEGSAMAHFINYTSTTTTGAIISGALKGYPAANDLCDTEYPGSHMCTMDEILYHINQGLDNGNFTATFRISEGAPGYLANANDCDGWTSATSSYLGSIFVGSTSHLNTYGSASLVACSASRSIGCCRN